MIRKSLRNGQVHSFVMQTKIRLFRDGSWCGKQDLNLHEETLTRT